MLDLTTVITSVISLVLGGSLPSILLLRETRRAKRLENEHAAIDNTNDIVLQWQQLLKESTDRNDRLRDQLAAVQKENNELKAENNTLTTTEARLHILKCIRIDCTGRKPPLEVSEELAKGLE